MASELERIKKYLKNANDYENAATIDGLPLRFFERFVMHGIHVDLLEPSRLNTDNFLYGGATAMLADLIGSSAIYTSGIPMIGVSVEINISYLDATFADEEIEIEAKVLRVGKSVGVVMVELRKKGSGKIIAQGCYTKYLTISSKI